MTKVTVPEKHYKDVFTVLSGLHLVKLNEAISLILKATSS